MAKKSTFVAVGNEELAVCPPLAKHVRWTDGKVYPVQYGERIMPDGSRAPSEMLAYIVTDGGTYLVGLQGKLWNKDAKNINAL